jgi:hypothetical protein
MNPQSARPVYTARPGEAIRVFRDADLNFAIGVGRIAIARGDTRFVNNVVRDLWRLVRTPAGEEVLQQGDAVGARVSIVKPDPPTEPPNAWIVPDELVAAAAAGARLGRADGSPVRFGTGAGCGSTIVYDPADWPLPWDPDSPSSVEVLLLLLRQANRNARGASDPCKPDWGSGTEAER